MRDTRVFVMKYYHVLEGVFGRMTKCESISNCKSESKCPCRQLSVTVHTNVATYGLGQVPCDGIGEALSERDEMSSICSSQYIDPLICFVLVGTLQAGIPNELTTA